MNFARYIVSSLVVFAFIYLYEWFFHGVIMKPMYIATQNLWRPAAEMKVYFPYIIIGQIILAFAFCYIFTRHYENKGVGEGARYGFLIAILMSAPLFMWYAVQPLAFKMIVYWVVAGFIELIIAGMLTALIYRSKRKHKS